MKQNLYCMYDRLAASYGPPQPARSDVVVARMFAASMVKYVEDQKTKGVDVALSDFDLVKIGTFDDETGELVGIKPASVPVAYPKESASGV